MTGVGFTLCLGPWQSSAQSASLRVLLTQTFIIEIVLVALLLAIPNQGFTPAAGSITALIAVSLIGLASGAYNAWFWTTQRSLFLAMTENTNTGRQYGNFQIFVTVFLKVGILIGGLLLDFNGKRRCWHDHLVSNRDRHTQATDHRTITCVFKI